MIKGQCHCQKVTWFYGEKLESVTACNCTLCRRYGSLWAYGYLGETITLNGQTSCYMHSSQINGFHFCSICGCLTHYLAKDLDSQGRRRVAVNLRMSLDPSKLFQLPIDHFDGLEKFEDLPPDGRCVKDLWF